jgi:hypothetical protein
MAKSNGEGLDFELIMKVSGKEESVVTWKQSNADPKAVALWQATIFNAFGGLAMTQAQGGDVFEEEK